VAGSFALVAAAEAGSRRHQWSLETLEMLSWAVGDPQQTCNLWQQYHDVVAGTMLLDFLHVHHQPKSQE
jgi:hypothetical protein